MAQRIHIEELKIEVDTEVGSWRTFLRNFELAAITTDFRDKHAVGDDGEKEAAAQHRKAAILLQAIGKQGMKIFNNFGVDLKDIKYEEVKTKFEQYFEGGESVDLIRYRFFAGRQREGETMERFISRMEDLGDQCQLQGVRDDIVKNVIIQGMKDETFKREIIRKENLTLTGLKSASAMHESADRTAKELGK